MPDPSNRQAKYNTPLRQAQRELTRSRIRDAARVLFNKQGYEATTMEQIASFAGLRRSTIYIHYNDKSDILSDIAAEYAPRAREMMARLPGPVPTAAQINRWIQDVIEFCRREETSLTILLDVGLNLPDSPSMRGVHSAIIEGLSENVPAFRPAVDPKKPDVVLRARCELLILELTVASRHSLYGTDRAYAAAMCEIVAQSFLSVIKAHHRAAPGAKSVADLPASSRRRVRP
jgi:AcrR family transcriptional regulator